MPFPIFFLEGATDSSCDVPDNLDRIEIGQDLAGATQFNGIIGNIKIWPVTTMKS